MRVQKQNSVHTFNRTNRQCNGEWARLEERIYNRTGVTCTVHVSAERISVKTRDYADWILARAAIEDQIKDLPITREL